MPNAEVYRLHQKLHHPGVEQKSQLVGIEADLWRLLPVTPVHLRSQ